MDRTLFSADVARERSRDRSAEHPACELKLFKDLIAPIVGSVTGIKPLAALPGSATNPYPSAPMPQPVYQPTGWGGALPGGAPIPDYGPMPGSPRMQTAGFPALLGGAARLAPGAARLFGAAAGLVRSAAGKIRGVMLSSGKFLSSRKAAALAKKVGLEAAAVGLGISAVEMAEMVLADGESKARARNRGISGADLKRTKRTIRAVERMHQQIVSACRPAMPRRHVHVSAKRAACPPVRLVKVK